MGREDDKIVRWRTCLVGCHVVGDVVHCSTDFLQSQTLHFSIQMRYRRLSLSQRPLSMPSVAETRHRVPCRTLYCPSWLAAVTSFHANCRRSIERGTICHLKRSERFSKETSIDAHRPIGSSNGLRCRDIDSAEAERFADKHHKVPLKPCPIITSPGSQRLGQTSWATLKLKFGRDGEARGLARNGFLPWVLRMRISE